MINLFPWIKKYYVHIINNFFIKHLNDIYRCFKKNGKKNREKVERK